MSKKAGKATIREQFTNDLHEKVRRMGPAGFDKTAFAAAWMAKGVARSTAFRWMAEDLTPAGQELARAVNATAIRAALPVVAEPVVAVTAPVAAIEHIRTCIKVAQEVMEFARHENGKVKMAKTLMAASEHLRKCLETAVRLHEAMREVNQIEAMHDAILAEIEAEDPLLAARVVKRLQRLAETWSPV